MKLYAKLPTRRDEATFDAKQGIEVEPEFGALLYALVRIHKPNICVEIGTYNGESAACIGQALLENKTGQLITCDIDEECVAIATERLRGLPVVVRQQDGKKLLEQTSVIDFVHLDGGDPAQRLEQLKLIGDHNISPGGLVCWHDAVLWYPEMYEYFASKYDWPHLILPTPVGVAIFQRPE